MAGFGSMAPSYDANGLPTFEVPQELPPFDPTSIPQSQLSKIAHRLMGMQPGEPRVQLWPEKLARSAFTLPGDVVSGEQSMLPPGLRREDYTDAPRPSAPTEDSTWLGRAIGIAPVAAQPNDPAYERAQDTAGIAGGGMMFGRMAGPAETGLRVLGRQVMQDSTPAGGPLAALEQGKALAVERRNKGYATGKSAPGWDFKRPDPIEEFDRLHAAAREAYKMQAESPPNPLMTTDDQAFINSGRFLEDSAATGAPLSALEKGPAGAYHGLLDQPKGEAYNPAHGPEIAPAREAQSAPAPGRNDARGAGGGDAGVSEAQAAAARRAGTHQPLEGLPTKAMKIGDEHFVPGPIASVKDVAAQYMADKPKSSFFKEPTQYHQHDPEHGAAIAQAFEDMKHMPNDPATKNSYKALVDETLAQYQAIKKSGLKIEAIEPGMPDPYAKNPRLAAKDVADNNHLWFFPTDQGYGTGGMTAAMRKHPMLQKTGEKLGDRDLLANDVFRVVHDYFGHLKEGHGFRAGGEDNAWRSHAAMYSDLARPAMTTETRGQNSWVNFGPHGERNRTASAADTVYADQKVGLMPEWTMRDRGSPEPIIAYHGSPHGFANFDMSKIGSGEGAQVFGHGLYTAENPKVAKMYRDQLARGQTWEKNGETAPLHHVMEDLYQAMYLPDHMPLHPDQSGQIIKQITDLMEKGKSVASIRKNYDGPRGFEAYWNAALDRAETYKYNRHPGHTYQVAIDKPRDEFLDWNKPFSEQPTKVQEMARPILEERQAAQKKARDYAVERANRGDLIAQRGIRNWKPIKPIEQMSGEEIHKTLGLPAKDPDEMRINSFGKLKAAGIPGIKYLDQGSRGRGLAAGKTYNFVTHDEPRILRRYALPGLIGGGATFGAMARDDK